MEKQTLDIGEVIEQSGLPASTLRYYEEKGLIASIGRNGLRRVFAADVVQRLALIMLGRNAGFTLAEIAAMFGPDAPAIDRAQLHAKADELDRTIAQLQAMRDGLRHTADCTAPNHFECPTFQKLMRIALKNQQRKRLTR